MVAPGPDLQPTSPDRPTSGIAKKNKRSLWLAFFHCLVRLPPRVPKLPAGRLGFLLRAAAWGQPGLHEGPGSRSQSRGSQHHPERQTPATSLHGRCALRCSTEVHGLIGASGGGGSSLPGYSQYPGQSWGWALLVEREAPRERDTQEVSENREVPHPDLVRAQWPGLSCGSWPFL